MSVSRIAERYAKSLLDLSVERKSLDAVLGDIQSFRSMMDQRELFLLIKSPIVSRSKKSTIFQSLFKDSFNDLTLSFIDVLLRKGREEHLPEIADHFIKQYKAYKGITEVTLTTAGPLKEETLNAIRARLKDSSVTAETVDLQTKVDADLLGGFVLEIEDKLYDNSVAHQLNKLKKQFSK